MESRFDRIRRKVLNGDMYPSDDVAWMVDAIKALRWLAEELTDYKEYCPCKECLLVKEAKEKQWID